VPTRSPRHGYDLLVVGGGTAGLTAAVLAAGLGARTALVERDRTGGDCLWTGCVPSKSLLATAELVHAMRHADRLGLDPATPTVDLGRVLARVRDVQARIEPHDSPDRLRRLGVDVIAGEAAFTGARTVQVDGVGALQARAVLLATGSEPVVPPIEGLEEAGYLTTDTVWELDALPDRLLVLGGGPVGCELGMAFARLGARVTIVEADGRLLPREEPEVGELLAERLSAEGVTVLTGTSATCVDVARSALVTTAGGARGSIGYDRLLVATRRRARTAGLRLEAAGVRLGPRGGLLLDSRLRTTAAGVYAAGDVTGELPFTHVAAYQAGVATLNALFWLPRKADHRALPWVTFTDPEVARVGLTEAQARERWGTKVRTARFDYGRSDRALAAGRAYGFAKLVGDPNGRLVGATVAAPAGGEVIGELAGIIGRRGRMDAIYRKVHPYPTYALSAAMAGGELLRERWFTERTRRVTEPVLSALRWGSGLRR
jgi:pyruvate/2-oxoglutarate dehydrogenase complex dihydrolipoamide dehydrogenase (E3) component